MGGPYALDFGAVMRVGEAKGADLDLLADVLPAAEEAILAGIHGDGEEGDDG